MKMIYAINLAIADHREINRGQSCDEDFIDALKKVARLLETLGDIAIERKEEIRRP